jgi:Heparan-alpha-glucosaminide N-acetyltransferase, catalytic
VGAFIDVLVWQIYPFTTVDVLYLIGVALPLVALAHFRSRVLPWALTGLIFAGTPVLQSVRGYTPYPTEKYLWGTLTVTVDGQTTIANHWLVDGFFPLFPWLGFAMLGGGLGALRWRARAIVSFARGPLLALSLALFVSGCGIWYQWPGPLLARWGYSEMFYPPTLGFVTTAAGLIGILFWIVDRQPALPGYDALRALGESSLAMYITHLIFIRYVIKPISPRRVELGCFTAIYVALVIALIAIAYGLRVLKKRWRHRPLVLAIVLGG